jgi:predicted SnoaL-like aldol condensation-catalyzing enzyme/GNAT superfamily N-acetyltransferase
LNDPVTVRPVVEDDFVAWKPLWDGYNGFYGRAGQSALPLEISRTTWARFLDPAEPMHALVAESSGQLLGLAHFLFHRSTLQVAATCYLQDLYTVEQARGKGAGRRSSMRSASVRRAPVPRASIGTRMKATPSPCAFTTRSPKNPDFWSIARVFKRTHRQQNAVALPFKSDASRSEPENHVNTFSRFLVLALALCSPLALHAQVQVQANPNHEQLLASADPKLAANKRLVYDFWREVFEAGHMDLAPKYMTESYIQHNPNVPTGRAAFVAFFTKFVKAKPIDARVKAPLVAIVAEGDLVILTFAEEATDPKDPTKKYSTSWFDMFRIENGKIAEHWDAAKKE